MSDTSYSYTNIICNWQDYFNTMTEKDPLHTVFGENAPQNKRGKFEPCMKNHINKMYYLQSSSKHYLRIPAIIIEIKKKIIVFILATNGILTNT